jgi:predicted CDP-diglyceride synthetase/phosphatidate cytidylyltransferase
LLGEPLSSSLKRAILEVVVSGVAMSPAEVSCYASCTLLAASLSKGEDQTYDLIQQCVQFLQDNEFVNTQKIKGPDGNSLYLEIIIYTWTTFLQSSLWFHVFMHLKILTVFLYLQNMRFLNPYKRMEIKIFYLIYVYIRNRN